MEKTQLLDAKLFPSSQCNQEGHYQLRSDSTDINYNQNISGDCNASGLFKETAELLKWVDEQSAENDDRVPNMHGDSVGASQPSDQILHNNTTPAASNDLVPPNVMEWGHHQHIDTGNGLNSNGQLQEINWSNNFLPLNEPLVAPHFVPPLTDVVENNCQTASMPNMPVSGANSQLKNDMEPQVLQNMNTWCGSFGTLQMFNEPLNDVVSQQYLAGPPISSRVHPAVLQGYSAGASQQQNLVNNNGSSGTANLIASLADNAMEPAVMEWGHRQHISNGNGLNSNGQFQPINWNNNNLIPMNQPLSTPHTVPPVTDVVENNCQIPSMPNVPASGANSQLRSVMVPQFPRNMNAGFGPFGQRQRSNEPPNNIVSQQDFAGAAISSRGDPAVLQGIPVGASQHQNLVNNHGSLGTTNLLASFTNQAKEPAGHSVRGSQPSHQIPRKENTLATPSEPAVKWGHHQHISNGNGLNSNSQFQPINRSNNNLIPMNQSLITPHTVPPRTDVMIAQFIQNKNTGSGPFGQLQRPKEQINNIISQQNFVVAPIPSQVDRAVGATQHQNLEDNHGSPGTADLLASLADKQKEAGSGLQSNQHKDINVQLQLNDNQIPSAGSDMISVTVPQFVLDIPKSMPFNRWQSEILKGLRVVVVKVLANIRNIDLPIPDKVTIGQKRDPFNSEEHVIMKRKKLQGATENDSSYDTKMNTVDKPHDSKGKKVQGATGNGFSSDTKINIIEKPHDSKDILRPGIKSSTIALSDKIPMGRNQTALGVIQKSGSINLSPQAQVEAQNAESMQEIPGSSQPRRPRFSVEEIGLLIGAVDNCGIGAWQDIKQKFFPESESDRTFNELKDKWRSLVKKANKPASSRRGPVVPQELLDKVLEITKHNGKRQGKPL